MTGIRNAVMFASAELRFSYWGDGGDGSGQNELGKTLMRVRDQLKIQAQQKT
jgi:predicted NAD-dependent protein-ADP-ribosyltransferase YbiA (DUF1768 family)